jgi:hypothetical protein
MTMRYMNMAKLAVLVVGLSANVVMQANVETSAPVTKKSSNLGNVVKASFLAGSSLLWSWLYYGFVKERIVKSSISSSIEYALGHPEAAIFSGVLLSVAAGYAMIARDYVLKIWNKQENVQDAMPKDDSEQLVE